jgi:hypothetical protein
MIYDTDNEQDQAALLEELKRINATPEADLSIEDKLRIAYLQGRSKAQKIVDVMMDK